jgi:hypothetical protein
LVDLHSVQRKAVCFGKTTACSEKQDVGRQRHTTPELQLFVASVGLPLLSHFSCSHNFVKASRQTTTKQPLLWSSSHQSNVPSAIKSKAEAPHFALHNSKVPSDQGRRRELCFPTAQFVKSTIATCN